jgi:muramoyltetrapeptide carboxypeptidase
MKIYRRDLLKALSILPFVGGSAFAARLQESSNRKMIKPRRLKPGDTVALIAPSSSAAPDAYQRAIKNIEGLGFKVKQGKYAAGKSGDFSGTDAQRLEDLHWAFSDKSIDAVWCLRGGTGAPRLLPSINYDLIRKNPKIFIGYSDITALHLAINQRCGLVTFHGPVGTSEYSDYTRSHVLKALTTTTSPVRIAPSEFNQAQPNPLYTAKTIVRGQATGTLIGGNLSLLSAVAGTPWGLRDLAGKILFIEDINEAPYRVERMFTQLRNSTDMRKLAGIALGIFEKCDPPAAGLPTVMDYAKDRFGDLGIPVAYGLSFGHIRDQFTLPVGTRAELDADRLEMTLLESAVT